MLPGKIFRDHRDLLGEPAFVFFSGRANVHNTTPSDTRLSYSLLASQTGVLCFAMGRACHLECHFRTGPCWFKRPDSVGKATYRKSACSGRSYIPASRPGFGNADLALVDLSKQLCPSFGRPLFQFNVGFRTDSQHDLPVCYGAVKGLYTAFVASVEVIRDAQQRYQ